MKTSDIQLIDHYINTYKQKIDEINLIPTDFILIYICYRLSLGDSFSWASIKKDLHTYRFDAQLALISKALEDLEEMGLLQKQLLHGDSTDNQQPKAEEFQYSISFELSQSKSDVINKVGALWLIVVRNQCPRHFYVRNSNDLGKYVDTELMSLLYILNYRLEGDQFLNLSSTIHRFLSDRAGATDWLTLIQSYSPSHYQVIFNHFQEILHNQQIVVLS